MKKQDFVHAPYEELYREVFRVDGDFILPYIPQDVVPTVEWVLTNHPNLTDRERDLMRMRFVDGMNLKECGDKYGVTRERVRQVIYKGVRKLMLGRENLYRLILSNGIGMYEEVKADYDSFREQEKEELLKAIAEADVELKELRLEATADKDELEEILNRDIMDCDFSVRTFNCLMRAGIRTVGDLTKVSNYQFMHMRNFGRRSLDEIHVWLRRHNLNAACLREEQP